MVYLDHAATTPLHPEVIKVMSETMQTFFGNPSSIHHYGRDAHTQLELARQAIAQQLGVKEHEIIFNSGGTESDNTAIIGTALSKQAQGKHIITTQIEHPAVIESMRYLEGLGFEVTYLPVDQKGQLAVSEVEAALRPDTILVSIMTANNETGNLLPIAEIGALLREHPAVFHTDAVQAYGKIPLEINENSIDLLSISAHKINGPKGIGFLYKRDGLSLPALLHGGEQEEKRRAGTENLAAIMGMAKAASLHTPEAQQAAAEQYQTFADVLMETLAAQGVDVQLNGDPAHKLPHILNLRFPGVSSDLLLMKLDLKGAAISTGSACTAGNVEPSHVLEAMVGKEHPAIRESVRVSFGYGNTLAEIEAFALLLAETVLATKK
ncbi:cysteine desulfurase family protein [Enterococcus casseliflavus]|uniref:cysteine desulfurase family protein n=1 Tax=Enterococcus TaxID=1350 RepID=UPI000E0170BC|nr:cysteine desulfurase family protein [Enterococcus casseliflavus]HCO72103.1 cysteine desulfurase NifS [Enterococcus sp.]MBE6168960.1 cysteine desulfurase [Enterococcus casseliflavus]MDB1693800.1 cysteine desulfurase family protein [Enterococcus casseliflavus]MDB1697430.1 cysteine desulfurase family protein [Enterococcus casseliflavus]MDB1701170.1 cysteine desulfurase family protein [Enterococcus casseliflavus]